MVRKMPPVRNLRPGYTVSYPNRDKAASKVTKAIVCLLMVVTVVLMLIVTIGGWSKLQGLKPVNLIWALLYLVIAFFVYRWKRGMLPIVAALAILLLILSVIAGLGAAGTSWFDRNHVGYAGAQSMFGSGGLSPDILGLVTLLIAPVQVLLIFFSMQGFAQGWSVEEEVPEDEAKRGRGGNRDASASVSPAAA